MSEENMVCNPNHTTGWWKREGKTLTISCECGHSVTKIDIDSPTAYKLFEQEAEVTIDGEIA